MNKIESLLPVLGPPAEFYIGFGYKERGISYVTYSEKLIPLSDQITNNALGFWSEMVLKSEAEVRKMGFESQLIACEFTILGKTGFTALELHARKIVLNKVFHGKFAAPFEVELF